MKKSTIMILFGVVFAVAVCIGIFWYYHPTHVAYNDRFVLGSTKAQIEARYGAFYSEGTNVCVYMIRDDTPELVMGYDNSLWYEIYFEDGVAVRVALRKGYVGG